MTADARKKFIWRGRDDDEKRLTDVIADRAAGEIFNVDGYLAYLDNGRPVGITPAVMRDIIARHVGTPRLIERGTADERKFDVVLEAFAFPPAGSKWDQNKGPNEKTLLNMIKNLVDMVAKAPRPPVRLQPGQIEIIRSRLKTGEPASLVAAAFRAELEQIREIGVSAGIHVH
jgi:hypothetical protein